MKDAVNNAVQYANELFSEHKLQNLLLEEIEKEGKCWSVTLAFTRTTEVIPMFGMPKAFDRNYKKFLIDGENGELVAIKIREAK